MSSGRPPATFPCRINAASFLCFYCVLLFALPAQLIVPGMGAGGGPASLLALVGLGWWVVATLIPGEKTYRTRNPVRFAIIAYLAIVLVTWITGKTRPLTPLESTTSDRAMLALLGLVGIAMIAIDGLETRADVEQVIRWMVGASMIMVIVGLVQFYFNYDLARYLRLPGLQYNSEIGSLRRRSIFNRPRGTTLHSIELGVVSASLIPIAYWRTQILRTKRSWVAVPLLALSAMVSLSRSAILAIAIVGAVFIIGVTWRQRLAIVALASVFVVAVGVLVDGLVGTIGSLFTNADNDPSVQARLDRFPAVVELVAEYPWFGRGFGTFTPEDYLLLDNEIQKSAIETGLIGVTLLILFVLFVAMIAWNTRGSDDQSKLPGTALAATILGLFISMYTFDAFFYRILMGVLYLSVGIVGALWRITLAERSERATTESATSPHTRTQFTAI